MEPLRLHLPRTELRQQRLVLPAETITQAPAAYNSMLLVIIGVLLGIIAAAAVLFIVTRGKEK